MAKLVISRQLATLQVQGTHEGSDRTTTAPQADWRTECESDGLAKGIGG